MILKKFLKNFNHQMVNNFFNKMVLKMFSIHFLFLFDGCGLMDVSDYSF